MVVQTKYVEVDREELRELREESAELARLRAQPARQVGDEREQFEASMSESVYFNPEGFQHDSGAWVYSDYTTDVAWMAWSRRAALAPAAVVMPPSPYMPGVEPEALSDYERGEAQGRCDMWAEVARLNRNQIPADLIGRCIQLLEFHSGYSGDAEQYAANELRALLGKDEK